MGRIDRRANRKKPCLYLFLASWLVGDFKFLPYQWIFSSKGPSKRFLGNCLIINKVKIKDRSGIYRNAYQ